MTLSPFNMKSIIVASLCMCIFCSPVESAIEGVDTALSVVSAISPVVVPSEKKHAFLEQDGIGFEGVPIESMSGMGLVTLRGFKAEVHYAVTQDGYYIHVLRLVNPLLGGKAPPKRPIVFNHGLLESAVIWLVSANGVRPEDEAMGYCLKGPIDSRLARNRTEFLNGPMLLANHGYDVWLMSMRGTDFSLYHKRFDTSSEAFWDYSLDNFIMGDVPSVINYVRRYTGSKKVAYAGHSQATFAVFGLLATMPHYADIIEPVFAIAPVSYVYHLTSTARGPILNELRTPNMQGPLPDGARTLRNRFAQICPESKALNAVCRMIDIMLGGPGKKSLGKYLSFFPSASSHKVFRHFGQMIKSESMSMYDHGPAENLRRYGSRKAPLYHLDRIRSKSLVLIWTKTDSLSEVRDVMQFKRELRVPLYRDIFIDRAFNHFDMITHEDASYLVFAPMLEVLEEFERANGVCRLPAGSLVDLDQLGEDLQSL